jgi:ribonuclease P protein component
VPEVLTDRTLGGEERYSFPKAVRLLNRADFVKLNRSGKRYSGRHFVILLKQNSLENSRLGVTVSKKVGNAVKRNRVKRLLREVFRLNNGLFPRGCDIIIAAKHGAGDLDFPTVREEIGGILADKNSRT